MSDSNSLRSRIRKLRTQKPVEGEEYFSIGLLGNEDGSISTTCQTQWVGWADEQFRTEIRVACPVDPEKTYDLLESAGQPGVIVNSEDDFGVFVLIGGYGIVVSSLCKEHLPSVVGEREVVKSVSSGLVSADQAPDEWLRRAPSRKKRMSILKRDDLQCQICGRSPHDYVDVELHVHHIRPWGKGGLTEEENLIAICKTCHDGLDPHYDPGLFDQLGYNPYPYVEEGEMDYKAKVLRYRELIQEKFESREP